MVKTVHNILLVLKSIKRISFGLAMKIVMQLSSHLIKVGDVCTFVFLDDEGYNIKDDNILTSRTSDGLYLSSKQHDHECKPSSANIVQGYRHI
ncbi:hypothetical protein HanPI659440_Chr15g0598571 [Helianthus annuus]|nr:hypothetical protein HanPI659440_Chr15g0598571 [Helianthus annuus]